MYTAIVNVNRPEFQNKGVMGEVHSEGCRDLRKVERDDYVRTVAVLAEAMQIVVDAEMVEMGYDESYVHVMPCTGATLQEIAAARDDWKDLVGL